MKKIAPSGAIKSSQDERNTQGGINNSRLLFDYAAKCKMIEKGFSHGAKGKPVTNEKKLFYEFKSQRKACCLRVEDKTFGVDVQRICTISLRVIGRICSQHEA